jgi:DNA-binding response OmpR family regulator
MSGEKILVIEDEADILEVITYNLRREGLNVLASRDGEEGLDIACKQSPDLIVLDLMLPGLDGIEICRRLKLDPLMSGIAIIMVTAKGEESDIVLGLGVGADDYLTRPFSPKELVARVKAVLRRGPLKESAEAAQRLRLGALDIDAAKHRVLIDGASIDFTATEFRLLHYLASHPGRVFTRNQLLNRIIGDDAIVIDRNIDVHIRSIRQKLGRHRDLIETQRGVGYRFQDSER